MNKKQIKVRGLLIHLTHYDPAWMVNKHREKRYDQKTAFAIVDALEREGFNTLVIDIKDGVHYAGHPEMRRPYSAPMRDLQDLCAYARSKNLDPVPKLNFSSSLKNHHDEWLRPNVQIPSWHEGQALYFKVARQCIHELVKVCKPGKYFHIGMDEDHHRSLRQFVEAIKKLKGFVEEKKLKAVIWNDTAYEGRDVQAEVHADKCRLAEDRLDRRLVQIVWDYDYAQPDILRRLIDKGYETWAAPGEKASNVKAWRKAVLKHDAGGMLMTHWIKCSRANQSKIIGQIQRLGKYYQAG